MYTVEYLLNDQSGKNHPNEVTFMTDHPDEMPPWWNITLMKDHPDERPSPWKSTPILTSPFLKSFPFVFLCKWGPQQGLPLF